MQELEVSQGFPTEGRIFKPPVQQNDSKLPRYVTVLGSIIEPVVATERPWTKGGGIEVGNPCLRYVKNFLRKGRITPVLEDVYDWVTVDYWDKATGKDASYFPRPIPPGYQPPTDPNGNPSRIPAMMGKMALPGEQIEQIVNGYANIFKRSRRGIVEIKSLKGVDYDPRPESELWKIQTAIFPKYPLLPILLDDTERLLIDAQVHSSLRTIIDEMLESLTQFRSYATSTVEEAHYTMRESAKQSEAGYIPRYSDVDFVLLEQLGMARQDINIRREAATPQTDNELRDVLKAFMQAQVDEKAELQRMRTEQVAQTPDASVDGEAVDFSTMAASPIDEGFGGASGYSGFSGEVTERQDFHVAGDGDGSIPELHSAPEAIQVFPCGGGCGFNAASLAGQKAHERFCEAVKKE